MDNIVSEIVDVINNQQSLLGIERSLGTYFTKVFSQFFSKALERIDLELILDYKEKGEKSIVPLDLAIGLKNHKRYSQ